MRGGDAVDELAVSGAHIQDGVRGFYPSVKVMAGEGLPHFDPALLDSGKSAAINGLLMLLVCHALIIRDLRSETLLPRIAARLLPARPVA